jgi:hypothetical protein
MSDGQPRASTKTMLNGALVALLLVAPLPLSEPANAAQQADGGTRKTTVHTDGRDIETVVLDEEPAPDGRPMRAGSIVVKFRPSSSRAARQAAHAAAAAEAVAPTRQPNVERVQVRRGEVARALAAYRGRGDVELAEPDYIVRAAGAVNDPRLDNQYGVAKINAPVAWAVTRSSAATRIAILDCGIFSRSSDRSGPDGIGHADVRDKVGSGSENEANFTTATTADDLCNHGTHVAGIAAASTNNGVGIAGVGYDAAIMNGKVLADNGSGSSTWLIDGIDWAVDNGAKVISMSLSGPGACPGGVQTAATAAWNAGVVLVAAAGNGGSDDVGDPRADWPANCQHVLGVAATDASDELAAFSNYKTDVDVAAPGKSILSTNNVGGYSLFSGTSQATPHVAGLAALLWSSPFGADNQAILDRIVSTGRPLTDTGGSGQQWSFRRIDAAAALTAVAPNVDCDDPVPTIAAKRLKKKRTYRFIAQVTLDPACTLALQRWTFSDGGESSLNVVTHTFPTDLIAVAHRTGTVLPGGAGIAQRFFAEHQLVTTLIDAGTILEQLEVPTAVAGIAVQAGADQLVVPDHQFLVDAAGRIRQHDFLAAVAAHEVAGRKKIDAGDLQLGRRHRAAVDTDAIASQVIGADLGLLEQRCDQAISDAAVAGALTHGIDARIEGLQRVADHDAACAVDTRGLCQLSIRTDARSHDHQIGRLFAAVRELHCPYFAVFVAQQFGGGGVEAELQTAIGQRTLQQLSGHRIQLALQQPPGQMHHGDVHATQLQTIGGLQAQQAATDHHRMPLGLGGFDHRLRVVDIAIADDAFQVLARYRQDDRQRTRRQQQAVVFGLGAVGGDHSPLHAVDLRYLLAQVQTDAAFGVPVQRVQHDVVEGLLAGQHRRQQDAVVVGVRFGAEHGDVVHVRRQLQQFFQRADARHAVAHHDQSWLLHRFAPGRFNSVASAFRRARR